METKNTWWTFLIGTIYWLLFIVSFLLIQIPFLLRMQEIYDLKQFNADFKLMTSEVSNISFCVQGHISKILNESSTCKLKTSHPFRILHSLSLIPCRYGDDYRNKIDLTSVNVWSMQNEILKVVLISYWNYKNREHYKGSFWECCLSHDQMGNIETLEKHFRLQSKL